MIDPTRDDPTAVADALRPRTLAWLALASGAGALAGLLWSLWAPRDVLKVVNGQAFPDGMQSEAYIAAEGIATALLVAFGILITAAIVARWRRQPLIALTVAAASAVVGSVVFWIIATAVHAAQVAQFPTVLVPGTHPLAPLTVRMPAVYITWLLTAVVIVAIQALVLWVIDRPDSEPDDFETAHAG